MVKLKVLKKIVMPICAFSADLIWTMSLYFCCGGLNDVLVVVTMMQGMEINAWNDKYVLNFTYTFIYLQSYCTHSNIFYNFHINIQFLNIYYSFFLNQRFHPKKLTELFLSWFDFNVISTDVKVTVFTWSWDFGFFAFSFYVFPCNLLGSSSLMIWLDLRSLIC